MKKFLLPVGIIALLMAAVLAGVVLKNSSDRSDDAVAVLGAQIESQENRMGNKDAKIQLIEYGDLQCSACAAYDPIVMKLVSENSDWINFSFRHLPLYEIHRNAYDGSYAVQAAALQGKFFEMKELLYANQQEWAEMPDPMPMFVQYAKELNMEEDSFVRDFDSKEVRDKVAADSKTGRDSGFNSTPTFVVNGKKINNPGSYDEFVALLRKELPQ